MSTCSLIISTYNWPQALSLCLGSVASQTKIPDEIIVCDDGSREDTAKVVEQFKQLLATPVIHIWQPDEGFQLARIRNKGIAAAKGDYIIQIDGDLILHKHFINDHLKFKKKGFFTTGSRVLLSPETSQEIFKTQDIGLVSRLKGNKNFVNRLRIPFLHDTLSTRYKNKGRHKYYVKGCNMAFWKKDLVAVNGYNESFTGWGREDSEIAIRLINNGVNKRFLKFGGVCYHLYHNEASKELHDRNLALMEKAVTDKITWADKGISQYA